MIITIITIKYCTILFINYSDKLRTISFSIPQVTSIKLFALLLGVTQFPIYNGIVRIRR